MLVMQCICIILQFLVEKEFHLLRIILSSSYFHRYKFGEKFGKIKLPKNEKWIKTRRKFQEICQNQCYKERFKIHYSYISKINQNVAAKSDLGVTKIHMKMKLQSKLNEWKFNGLSMRF